LAKIIKLTVFLGVLALLILGCSQHQNPMSQSDLPETNPVILPSISLPLGATVESATLMLNLDYILGGGPQTINVHRVTAPWEEMTVTYTSFGNAYDPTPVTSFVVLASGWYNVDLTSLVQDWVNGTYPDYGILLEVGTTSTSSITRFFSNENGDPSLAPKLELCYSLGGGAPICVTIKRGVYGDIEDTELWPPLPWKNFGWQNRVLVGYWDGYLKHALLQFDADVIPELAAIGDTVWLDSDQDGIQDADEAGFPDVTVNLYVCGSTTPLHTMTTDENGFYKFDNLITPG